MPYAWSQVGNEKLSVLLRAFLSISVSVLTIDSGGISDSKNAGVIKNTVEHQKKSMTIHQCMRGLW